MPGAVCSSVAEFICRRLGCGTYDAGVACLLSSLQQKLKLFYLLPFERYSRIVFVLADINFSGAFSRTSSFCTICYGLHLLVQFIEHEHHTLLVNSLDEEDEFSQAGNFVLAFPNLLFNLSLTVGPLFPCSPPRPAFRSLMSASIFDASMLIKPFRSSIVFILFSVFVSI